MFKMRHLSQAKLKHYRLIHWKYFNVDNLSTKIRTFKFNDSTDTIMIVRLSKLHAFFFKEILQYMVNTNVLDLMQNLIFMIQISVMYLCERFMCLPFIPYNGYFLRLEIFVVQTLKDIKLYSVFAISAITLDSKT